MNTGSDSHRQALLFNKRLFLSLPIFSWALYDLANTIFSSNVITIFFPFYLQQVIGGSEVMNQLASTFISYANAIASFFIVVFSPLLGVMIDRTGRKKRYLIPFTLSCITATLMMGLIAMWDSPKTEGGLPISIVLVILLFMVAKFFYNTSLIFYDAMLPDLVQGEKETPVVSGFGVALGYVGTLIGLGIYPFIGDQYHWAFIPSAVLFFVFSLPMMFLYKEKGAARQNERSFLSGYKEILESLREMKAYPAVWLFMIAYFFFNDAIATAIAMMAIYAKTIAGFTTGQFILLYLVSTVTAIVGSFVFGYIHRAVGSKKAVASVAVILMVAIALASGAVNQVMFWIAGSLYGVAMGAMWATSRTFIIELTPEEKRGQFFGLFAFSGKVSSIVGPVLYGTITLVLAETGNLASRIALGSLIILVAIGIIVLMRIKTS
ncbi:MFS transporter [Ammoniphilus sp. CFH 90114]|uniref:MFS transporter n=1 Tax=Ammoniphilus sp. CFH 90114 TaxID=2493665 RepID=UPI00100F5076|nr:MFS transporter [Ammoniphilus sp. CFH 90114]RXT05180.1 MFS transporter [Ammoniphilus sp. CFH 90114]